MKIIFLSALFLSNLFLFSFKANQSFIFLSEKEATSLERDFFKDAKDGALDDFGFIEGYFIATGIVDREEYRVLKKAYEGKKKAILSEVSRFKNNRTKASKLCELMHEKRLLTSYHFDAVFSKPLVKEGLFNCISSSAVYRDLLISKNIPSKFAFAEKHVYKYVLLNNTSIQTEPTNPYGFDPGAHNVVIRSDGSRSWTPKVNYSNPKLVGDLKFLASLYLDERICRKLAKGDIDKNIALCKKGLLLDPNNTFLQQNFIYWTSKKVNRLYSLKEFDTLKHFVISSIQVFPKGAYMGYRGEMMRFIAYSLSYQFEQKKHDLSEEILRRLKTLLSKSEFETMLLTALGKTNQSFVSKNQFEEAMALMQFASRWLGDSGRFKKQKSDIKRIKAKSKNKFKDLLRHYAEQKKAKRFDKRSFLKDMVAISYPLGLLGEMDKLRERYFLIKEAFGKQIADSVYGALIVNLTYEHYQSARYEDGLELYDFSKAILLKDSSIDTNYLALVDSHANKLFFNRGLDAAIVFLVLEEKKSKQVFLRENYFTSKLSEFAEKEMKRNNSFDLVSFLKKLKADLKQGDFNIFLKQALINGTYTLIKEGYYKKAMDLVQNTIEFGFDKNIIKENYIAAVDRRVKSVLFQKDEEKALSIFSKAIKLYPNWVKLNNLLTYHLGSRLESLLIEGRFEKTDVLFPKIKSLLKKDSFEKLLKNAYVNASYRLTEKKAYSQALFVVIKGLSEVGRGDSGLLNNYRYVLNEYLNDLKSKNINKAKSLLKKAVNILGNQDEVVVFWKKALGGF